MRKAGVNTDEHVSKAFQVVARKLLFNTEHIGNNIVKQKVPNHYSFSLLTTS